MKRSRYQQGSVYLDQRRGVWSFKFYEGGTRRTVRLGTIAEIPTRAKALRMADGYRLNLNAETTDSPTVTFEAAARKYMAERMPKRYTTSVGYKNNLEKHLIPKWGATELKDIKPLSVDRWFSSLPLAGKTKGHIKGVMRQVLEYAMLCELFEAQRNPLDLVRVERGTMREHEPRVLTRKNSPDYWSSFPTPCIATW